MATINAVGNGLSGSTGSGGFVGSTSPTLVTPTIGAATATSITFSPTTGGIVGTTTNDNVTAGDVGELITANASGVSVTTATDTNITSVSLTAGDWDVYATINFQGGSSVNLSSVIGGLSSTSATQASTLNRAQITFTAGTISIAGLQVAPFRFSLSGTTTIYCVATATFTGGTLTAGSIINARRRR